MFVFFITYLKPLPPLFWTIFSYLWCALQPTVYYTTGGFSPKHPIISGGSSGQSTSPKRTEGPLAALAGYE